MESKKTVHDFTHNHHDSHFGQGKFLVEKND